MMRKILFVSQRYDRGGRALGGKASRVLASLANVDQAELVDCFDYLPLLPKDWQGDSNAAAAVMLARGDALRKKWRGRKAVLLGSTVAAAFRLRESDYVWFKPIEIHPGIEVAVMPHPGGVAAWWHDPANAAAAREFVLRAKLGFFETNTRDPRERFTVDQIAAALEAGRGVYTWAAEALAEETGRSCSSQTIKNYVDRYPDALQPVLDRMRVAFFGRAAKNIIQSVEAGDVHDSWRAWQTRPARDVMGQLGTNLVREISSRINGQLEHQHQHQHAHLHAKLAQNGIDLTRYTAEQLLAIEDMAARMIDDSDV